MLKEQAKFIRRLGILTDLLILFVSMWLAYLLRGQQGVRSFNDYLDWLVLTFLVWPFLLSRYGLYDSIRRRTLANIIGALTNVHFLGGALLAAAIFLLEPTGFSRDVFLCFWFISYFFIVVVRLVVRLGLGYFRRRGYNYRSVMVVGAQEKAIRFCELIADHADWGVHLLGLVQVDPKSLQESVKGYKVLGRVEDLVTICKANPVDEVVFCLPRNFFFDAEAYLKELESLGITVRMVLDFYEIPRSKKELSFFHDDIPILTFHTKSLDAQQLFLKRLLDIVGALVGLLITGMVFPMVALAIKKAHPGPYFSARQGSARVGAPLSAGSSGQCRSMPRRKRRIYSIKTR